MIDTSILPNTFIIVDKIHYSGQHPVSLILTILPNLYVYTMKIFYIQYENIM